MNQRGIFITGGDFDHLCIAHETAKRIGLFTEHLPIIVTTHLEKEIRMRGIPIVVFALNSLHNLTHPLGISAHTNILLGSVQQKKPSVRTNHRYQHQKQGNYATHTLSSGNLKLPRGIHRDLHGRPQKQKLTPSRLTRRNSSRK